MAASQMASAELERTTVDIDAGAGAARSVSAPPARSCASTGSSPLYQEGRDDEAAPAREPTDDDDDGRLPPMTVGDPLAEHGIAVEQHFTEPPPRYTEATLIKKMEELGIGRPSTYTATLSVLRDRGYVRLEKKQLIPEDKGRLVTAFLESFFERYVEYDFTADLEEKLDKISNGDLVLEGRAARVLAAVLRRRRRDQGPPRLRGARGSERAARPAHLPARADGGDPRQCPICGTGQLSLKLGKFGAFVGCSNYPECRFTRQLAVSARTAMAADFGGDGTRALGTDPETGLERHGPHRPLRRPTSSSASRARASKPKRVEPAGGLGRGDHRPRRRARPSGLPREVGVHPGRRQADHRRHRPLRAVRPARRHVRQPRLGRGGVLGRPQPRRLAPRREASPAAVAAAAAAAPKALKELGEHPTEGGPITVRDGRYGPYVNHGKVNATLAKDNGPANVTVEQALELIAARAGKSPKKRAAKAERQSGREGPLRPDGEPPRQNPKTKAAPKESTAKSLPRAEVVDG